MSRDQATAWAHKLERDQSAFDPRHVPVFTGEKRFGGLETKAFVSGPDEEHAASFKLDHKDGLFKVEHLYGPEDKAKYWSDFAHMEKETAKASYQGSAMVTYGYNDAPGRLAGGYPLGQSAGMWLALPERG